MTQYGAIAVRLTSAQPMWRYCGTTYSIATNVALLRHNLLHRNQCDAITARLTSSQPMWRYYGTTYFTATNVALLRHDQPLYSNKNTKRGTEGEYAKLPLTDSTGDQTCCEQLLIL